MHCFHRLSHLATPIMAPCPWTACLQGNPTMNMIPRTFPTSPGWLPLVTRILLVSVPARGLEVSWKLLFHGVVSISMHMGPVVPFLDLSIPTTDSHSQDYACSRYDNAYPYLVHTDGRLGDPKKRDFKFKSCSGAVMKEIHEDQVLQLEGSQDVIMISAGESHYIYCRRTVHQLHITRRK